MKTHRCNRQWRFGYSLACALSCLLSRRAIGLLITSSMAVQVHADAGSNAGSDADSNTDSNTVTELHRLLDERDRIIESLQDKVTHLQRGAITPDPSQNPAASTPDVDPLTAEHALERTLTQSGALLLPADQAELQIGAMYARTQQQSITVARTGKPAISILDLRRNDYGTSVSARIGLPFDTQLEMTVPYRLVTQSQLTSIDADAPHETHTTASVMGDISAGVATTLLHERGWRPDVIGRLGWNAGTGREDSHGVPIGDGFKKIRTELTLLKRQDPLVFTGNLSYESTFKKNAVKPGDQFGVSLSALLATSPDTSLSIGIDQTFSKKTRLNGAPIAGSDQVSGLLTLGATSTIGQRTLLSVTAGKGLTKGAPDYFISVAVPIRFELFK